MTFYLHYRYLGVTPPISVAESNKREKEVTVTLMEELRNQNTFETEAESRTRWVFCPVFIILVSVFFVFGFSLWPCSVYRELVYVLGPRGILLAFTIGFIRLGVNQNT